jgi:cephalosporin hydroxylase
MQRSKHDPKDMEQIRAMSADAEVGRLSLGLMELSVRYRYSYNFTWLGVPIIQYPEDLVALAEIVWAVRPDLIVETGIAHGGSLVFYASMQELIGGGGRVLGIDIDIRAHNRSAIEAHPMSRRIDMLQGSSTDGGILALVAGRATGRRVMVVLDSNHTEEHVLDELRAYAPFVTEGSYLIVLDTMVENLPAGLYPDRPWDVGNNPMTAVNRFLEEDDNFVIDEEYDNKLLLTVAPRGYLKRVKS